MLKEKRKSPGIKSIIRCGNCGKDFYVIPYRLNEAIKKGTQLCCSYKCGAKLKRSKSINNARCFICNTPFHVKPHHLQNLRNPNMITCSRMCGAQVKSLLYSGTGNHQFGLKGELNASYKSDYKINIYGYLLARTPHHPNKNCDDFVFFHRLIMEEYLREVGEYGYLKDLNGYLVLRDGYVVHHIDEIKLNNCIENLKIMTLQDHTSLHSSSRTNNKLVETPMANIGLTDKPLFKKFEYDAGQDISSNENILLRARSSAKVYTGTTVLVPCGCVGLLWSRSGLSIKHKIEVGAGCIDHGYIGEIIVHLYNHSDEDFQINVGDRIAQLLTLPIDIRMYKTVSTEEIIETNKTNLRHTSGIGSTGGF